MMKTINIKHLLQYKETNAKLHTHPEHNETKQRWLITIMEIQNVACITY